MEIPLKIAACCCCLPDIIVCKSNSIGCWRWYSRYYAAVLTCSAFCTQSSRGGWWYGGGSGVYRYPRCVMFPSSSIYVSTAIKNSNDSFRIETFFWAFEFFHRLIMNNACGLCTFWNAWNYGKFKIAFSHIPNNCVDFQGEYFDSAGAEKQSQHRYLPYLSLAWWSSSRPFKGQFFKAFFVLKPAFFPFVFDI